jgi:DNA-binding NarL/FixJ family response regulator
MTHDDPAVRVLLVDDDPMVCQGLELMLSSAPDVEVVGRAADGDEAVAAVQAHRPDVVLMDVRMQRVDGLAATRAVLAEPRPPRVLVLTTFGEDDEAVRAVQSGAAGFLLKTESPQAIIAAVRGVAAGDGVLSGGPAARVLAHLQGDPRRVVRDRAALQFAGLTDREREVAALVAAELTNEQIARRLHLGLGTVKSHLATIQAKLACSGRVGIAVLADRAGLMADPAALAAVSDAGSQELSDATRPLRPAGQRRGEDHERWRRTS